MGVPVPYSCYCSMPGLVYDLDTVSVEWEIDTSAQMILD